MNTVLESQGLSKSYQLDKKIRRPVLNNVNLRINRGEFVSVMGPSGSGKSTLLYAISGMDRFDSGNVLFDGRGLADLSEKELAQLRLTRMGFIFQHIHLLQNLSLRDNIVLSGYLARSAGRAAVEERVEELMSLTGIAPLAGNSVNQASGGQLQRVGICRALINNPEILFGDEPTGALDSRSASEIMELLRGINAAGTTVLLVTHDVKVAAATERVLFMKDGQLVAEKTLGKYVGNGVEGRTREKELTEWLIEQGL